MLIVEAIDAGHGDAILVRYQGNGGYERVLLIDGGPLSAKAADGDGYVPYADHIVPRLMEIKAARDEKPQTEDIHSGEPALILDLVACTHIDDDHIAGIERLYGCLAGQTACAPDGKDIEAPRLWFNSFSTLLGNAVDIGAAVRGETAEAMAASVRQGENLTAYAQGCGATINEDAPGLLIAAGQVPKGFKPAKVTILAPGEKALVKLREDWLAAVERMGKKKPGEAASAGLDTGRFKADTAVANLSSIVMLIEVFGRRVLLTGDQRGDHVLDGLEDAKLVAPGGDFKVDILKVPHHGSIRNNPPEFIARVQADTYIFSANGKDQNPDTPVLERVAAQAKDRKLTMAFTNGDMVYAPDRKGEMPTLKGKTVRTLAEAIAVLQEDPDVERNVSFECRDREQHSLVFELATKD
jgi:hypothetical protein